MCVGGVWGWVGVNIEWGTLPYPTELKWKVGVKCVWGVGLVTLPHPILPYGVHVGYITDQKMKCGG